MCQIIKNLLNRNLSLHPASIETSLFPKALSHSRSAGFRAAVPHGVLGCFYIKPNFPGRCSRTEQSKQMHIKTKQKNIDWTRQSKQCGFSIYTFDNLKSKSMVRLVRAEKMVLSGLVFARKIARMILIQNI